MYVCKTLCKRTPVTFQALHSSRRDNDSLHLHVSESACNYIKQTQRYVVTKLATRFSLFHCHEKYRTHLGNEPHHIEFKEFCKDKRDREKIGKINMVIDDDTK